MEQRGRVRERAAQAPPRWRSALGGAVAVLLVVAGCGGESAAAPDEDTAPLVAERRNGDDGPLVLYSGRLEAVVGPLVEEFQDENDVEVEVRYGETGALVDALLEEGTRSPADAFLSHDATALGRLSRRGLLRELPMDVVRRVPAAFAAMEQKHDWVGLTARARTLVYDGSRQAPQGLPRGLEQLGDERYRGRFGIAPATAAFAEHMAVYRVLEGPEALDSLLARIRDNLPQTFPDDGAVVRAVAQGQVDFGVVNHQHVLRADEAERGRLRTVFMTEGEASAFVTPAGIGVLSDDPRALDLVRFLLGAESQRYMAAATREYPLASDAPPAPGLPPLASLRTPAVDFADVAAVLRETETAMRRAGLLR